jgi:hypothetical protein
LIPLILPGFNYSEELMNSVREVGDLYFFNTRTGAFIAAFTEAIEELQTLDQKDKANAQRAVDAMALGEEIYDIGVKSVQLGYKIYRTSRRIAALTPLIAADGPLPIGDIVFVGIAIIEIGLLTYDLATDVYELVSE